MSARRLQGYLIPLFATLLLLAVTSVRPAMAASPLPAANASSTGKSSAAKAPATTTTTITASATTVQSNTGLVLTITVSGNSPSGSVTIRDGSTPLGALPLSGGKVAINITFGGTGTHAMTAVYSGDANNAASTSPTTTLTITGFPTTTTLSSNQPNPILLGTPFTLTATVKGNKPSGTVIFTDGGKPIGAAVVNPAGVASMAVTPVSAGPHLLAASYSGDAAGNQASTSANLSAIEILRPTTTLLKVPGPAVVGRAFTMTATVNGMTGSGTVSLNDGTHALGTATLVNGSATFSTIATTAGVHSYSASFAGDSVNAASSSAGVSTTVGVSPDTVTLSVGSGNTAKVSTATTIGVALAGSVAPTGKLILSVNGAAQPAVTVTGSSLSLSYTFPKTGTYTVAASYSGDSNNAPASATVAVTVSAATTTTPPASKTPIQTNGIQYHGGPVMGTGANLYYIWYGNWAGSTTPSILTKFAQGIGGSPYFHILSTYTDNTGARVSDSVNLQGQTNDSYSQGKVLTDQGVGQVVASAISSGRLPQDPNGIYMVMGAADVNESSGLCTSYCAWHAHTTIGGNNVRFGFIGNPDRCAQGCGPAYNNPPNGNPSGDSMVTLLSHELAETVSDPDGSAWIAPGTNEVGDLCVGKYGTLTHSGSMAWNVTFPTGNFLVQEIWLNHRGGLCALSYP